MSQIIFNEKKEVMSLGRNGLVWTNGLDLDMHFTAQSLIITPINSRGHLSSCYVSIPKEHIQDLIDILEKLK